MILILNGPNLNLLGTREPEIYGTMTLEDLSGKCQIWGEDIGFNVTSRQSNSEGKLIDWIHQAQTDGFLGVVLNAGD